MPRDFMLATNAYIKNMALIVGTALGEIGPKIHVVEGGKVK